MQEFKDELKSHSVHVGHWQDADDAVATLYSLAQNMIGEVVVRPQGTIGNHHTL